MSALWVDIEVAADREEELQTLFAELVEEGADDELPPSFRMKGSSGIHGERRRDRPSSL